MMLTEWITFALLQILTAALIGWIVLFLEVDLLLQLERLKSSLGSFSTKMKFLINKVSGI